MASGTKAVKGAGKGPKKPQQEQAQLEATQTAETKPEDAQAAEVKPEDAQAAQTKPELPSLDITPVPRTSARARTSNTDSSEEKRRYTRKIFLGLLGVAFVGWGYSLGREWSPVELKERKLDSQGTRFDRTKLRFLEVFDYFSKPAWRELLPPPYPPPQGKPYTLLLEIDDLLVTSTWDVCCCVLLIFRLQTVFCSVSMVGEPLNVQEWTISSHIYHNFMKWSYSQLKMPMYVS